MTICKNCQKEVHYLYCPHCGQKIEQRLTLKVALEDMLRGITNGDSGVFLTIKELFSRPGKMIIEYLDGRRAIHFRPFPLLILITGLVILFDNWAETLHPYTDSDIVDKSPKNTKLEFDWFELTPVQAMMFVPFFAVSSRILFGKGYSLIEHMYITAFATIQRQIIFFITISIPSVFIDLNEDGFWNIGLYSCAGIFVVAMTYWDYKQIFKRSRRSTFWRVIMIFILVAVVLFIAFVIGVALMSAIAAGFKYLFQ